MPKKIYIIEAKLSSEKVKFLTENLDRKCKEYKRVLSCNIADYIVTELKSPSRIIRNVKKSTCPVLHISWLLESLKYDKPLNVTNYVIDVTEERRKMSLELSRRVDVNALPQQLTWEEVSDRRLNRSNQIFGKKEKLVKNSALQERNLFMKSYGSSTTSNSQLVYRASLNRIHPSIEKTVETTTFSLKRNKTIDTCSSSLPVNPSVANEFNLLENPNSSSARLETGSTLRFPLASKKMNISSSSSSSSKNKGFNSNHTTNDELKGADNMDDFDFSIVSTLKSSHEESCQLPRNNQSCSAEESASHTESTFSDTKDDSYNSSLDSQFSISKLLSL